MIQVEDKIISLDVFEKYFVCDLNACKGACCIEGDSGAPLLKEEEEILNSIYKHVRPYMSASGIQAIKDQGVAVYDKEKELTTPLVEGRECAFVINEKGISKCAIEKAYLKKTTNFRKPISCHLFPIRIKEYDHFDAINYEEIKICKSACDCGDKLKVPLYTFLKEPLIRKYGETWYNKLIERIKLLT